MLGFANSTSASVGSGARAHSIGGGTGRLGLLDSEGGETASMSYSTTLENESEDSDEV